jgi:hypothetical protein
MGAGQHRCPLRCHSAEGCLWLVRPLAAASTAD